MISDSKNGYPKGYYYDSVNINNATLGYNEIFDGEKEVGNLLWFVIVGDFLFNDSLVTYHRGLLLCRNTLVSGPRLLCWMLIWMVMWTWRSAPAHTETQVPWTITYVLIFCIWESFFYRLCLFPKPRIELSRNLTWSVQVNERDFWDIGHWFMLIWSKWSHKHNSNG